MFRPPCRELLAHFYEARLHAGVGLDQRTNGGAVGERGGEVVVFRILLARGEGVGGIESECVEQRAVVRDFGHRHAAKQMGAHVVRLGRRRVVHVAADVQIEVVGLAGDLGERDDAGVAGDVLIAVKGGDDFLDVLGAEVVLRAARVEFGIGIDEENLALTVGGRF